MKTTHRSRRKCSWTPSGNLPSRCFYPPCNTWYERKSGRKLVRQSSVFGKISLVPNTGSRCGWKRLADLRAEIVLLTRKEDRKVLRIVDLLRSKKVITDQEAAELLRMEPFAQV